jgi:hypothetical protein
MVDHDPITEPAGDMIAAHTLVEILLWLDDGREETFKGLAETLLGWQGRRLRDAISDTGITHLGKQQTALSPEASDAVLDRLARAAALVLVGAGLVRFLAEWEELAAQHPPLAPRLSQAVGGMIPLLVRRHEGDTAAAGVLLLRLRGQWPSEAPAQVRVDHDAQLAEHLYKQFAHSDAGCAEFLRGWLIAHSGFSREERARVLRTAAILGHWDVVLAFFESGYPYGRAARAGHPTPRAQLAAYIAERLDREAPQTLVALTQTARARLEPGLHDAKAMLEWFVALARRAPKAAHPKAARDALGLVQETLPSLCALARGSDSDLAALAQELMSLLGAPPSGAVGLG